MSKKLHTETRRALTSIIWLQSYADTGLQLQLEFLRLYPDDDIVLRPSCVLVLCFLVSLQNQVHVRSGHQTLL